MARVSIIIPVYNVEDYIETCLLSVLEQTNQNIEIILVDDCGNDKSMEIAANIIANHSNGSKVRFIVHNKNRGLSAARNTGIENSLGEYIYFLDSDDEIALDTIEVLLKQVDNYNTPDFVIGNYSLLDMDVSMPPLLLENGLLKTNKIILQTFVSHQWYMMAWNKLVKRVFLLENELFFEEGLLHEDNIWSFMLACSANSMAVVNNITYKYRIRENSIMHDKAEKLLGHYLKNVDLVYNYIKEYNVVNQCTYEFMEYMKRDAFRKMIHLNLSFSEKKENYILFRNYRGIYPLIKQSVYKNLRDLHYIMPLDVGFYMYLFYLKIVEIKNKLLFVQ